VTERGQSVPISWASVIISVVPILIAIGLAYGSLSSEADNTKLQTREIKDSIEKIDERLRAIETEQGRYLEKNVGEKNTKLQTRENKVDIEKLNERLRAIETEQVRHGGKLDRLAAGQATIIRSLERLAPATIPNRKRNPEE
jgi:archaellum component FlaC